MTQPQPPYPYPPYPSPYAPPQAVPYFGDPSDAILAPARRAAMLMFVLGGLILMLGACGIVSMLNPQSPEQTRQAEEMMRGLGLPTASVSPQTMRTAGFVEVLLIVAVGVMLVGLGVGVRKGSRGAAIGGLILSGLALLLGLLATLASGVMAIAAPPMLACACGSLLPVSMFGLLIWWLVQSLRAAGNWRMAQAQYQMQYWQFQQAAQAYGAGAAYGYGYGAPQQPSPAPPQAPADPNQGIDSDRAK